MLAGEVGRYPRRKGFECPNRFSGFASAPAQGVTLEAEGRDYRPITSWDDAADSVPANILAACTGFPKPTPIQVSYTARLAVSALYASCQRGPRPWLCSLVRHSELCAFWAFMGEICIPPLSV